MSDKTRKILMVVANASPQGGSKDDAVHAGNPIIGQQQHSGGEVAKLVIAALEGGAR